MIRGLVERHPLRAFDAIQLTSAMWAKRNLREAVTFVGADATAAALRVVNPEERGEAKG